MPSKKEGHGKKAGGSKKGYVIVLIMLPVLFVDVFFDRDQSSGNHHADANNGVETHRQKNDTPQLQRWVYEVSNHELTLAERFEKKQWEAERFERL